MFGIGFTELILISILAILFLGPDKLPETMVQIAKFMKSVKQTIGEAKSSLEEEMKIADLKEEALSYKKQLDSATSELKSFKNINYNDIMNDIEKDIVPAKEKKSETLESKSDQSDAKESVVVEQKNETVTYKRKSRKKKVKEEVEVEVEVEDTKEGEA
ncbi:Twin-arginine translocation protein TatB [hydrothermal vent metagenome]|uniref:Twin-arginine translocation protein TatB n=1 Tax=hydrothermal vent metagenome TaxID=652676 RepID=A0A1W1EFK8_9ZZZZ